MLTIHLLIFTLGFWNLSTEEGSRTEVLGGGFCEEGFWLGPGGRFVSVVRRLECVSVRDLLSDLLASVGAELGGAGTHDSIGWGDVCLFASET